MDMDKDKKELVIEELTIDKKVLAIFVIGIVCIIEFIAIIKLNLKNNNLKDEFGEISVKNAELKDEIRRISAENAKLRSRVNASTYKAKISEIKDFISKTKIKNEDDIKSIISKLQDVQFEQNADKIQMIYGSRSGTIINSAKSILSAWDNYNDSLQGMRNEIYSLGEKLESLNSDLKELKDKGYQGGYQTRTFIRISSRSQDYYNAIDVSSHEKVILIADTSEAEGFSEGKPIRLVVKRLGKLPYEEVELISGSSIYSHTVYYETYEVISDSENPNLIRKRIKSLKRKINEYKVAKRKKFIELVNKIGPEIDNLKQNL